LLLLLLLMVAAPVAAEPQRRDIIGIEVAGERLQPDSHPARHRPSASCD
jgi:hypothetical protein